MTETLRTLRWSTWLGWQIESNWADLRLFVLYVVIKPVTGSLMLVCMYYAAKQAATTRVPAEFLPYVYVSNACYGLVSAVMFGMSSVVVTDREHYRMLEYVYVSPARFQAYFVGRGVGRATQGVLGGAVTLAAGMLLPGIRDAVRPDVLDVGWLLAYLAVGAVMLWAAGMVLASAMLNMSRSAMFLGEGIAGLVYLLSGVVFPLSVLPGWVQPISQLLPTTYWLEGMRRALTGPPTHPRLLESPLATWTNGELLAVLAVTTAGLVVASQAFYRYSVRRAWQNGKIEEASGM